MLHKKLQGVLMRLLSYFFIWLLLATLLISVDGCGSPPDIPDYYHPQIVVPDRDQILSATPPSNTAWSAAEISTLTGLWLGTLPAVPPSLSNCRRQSSGRNAGAQAVF